MHQMDHDIRLGASWLAALFLSTRGIHYFTTYFRCTFTCQSTPTHLNPSAAQCSYEPAIHFNAAAQLLRYHD